MLTNEYHFRINSGPMLTHFNSYNKASSNLHSRACYGNKVIKVITVNSTLGFLRRNLGNNPKEVKQHAYLTLVLPYLEYACPVLDLHQQLYINTWEMVQRQAARFLKGNLSHTVTNLLSDLDFTPLSLATGRKAIRLTLFYKASSGQAAVTTRISTQVCLLSQKHTKTVSSHIPDWSLNYNHLSYTV